MLCFVKNDISEISIKKLIHMKEIHLVMFPAEDLSDIYVSLE